MGLQNRLIHETRLVPAALRLRSLVVELISQFLSFGLFFLGISFVLSTLYLMCLAFCLSLASLEHRIIPIPHTQEPSHRVNSVFGPCFDPLFIPAVFILPND